MIERPDDEVVNYEGDFVEEVQSEVTPGRGHWIARSWWLSYPKGPTVVGIDGYKFWRK